MPFDDDFEVSRQEKHFAGEIRGGRPDADIAKDIVLYMVGGCSCVSLFGSDRCRACRAYYLLLGFVRAAKASVVGEAGPSDVRGALAGGSAYREPAEDPLACRECEGKGRVPRGAGGDLVGCWFERCEACLGTGKAAGGLDQHSAGG